MANIRAIKEFVSPVHGNVYIGRVLEVKSAQAKSFIESGLAVSLDTVSPSDGRADANFQQPVTGASSQAGQVLDVKILKRSSRGKVRTTESA